MTKAHLLVDDFNDNESNTLLWDVYGPVSEVNQRIEISPAANGTQYGGYDSRSRYDLTGSSVHVKLAQALNAAAGTETFLKAAYDTNNKVYITISNGSLTCGYKVNGVYSDLVTVTYSSTVHAWLRLRESTGVTYWETSADGQTWTLLLRRPSPFDLTSVEIQLGAGTYQPVASPGTAIFLSVNIPVPASPRRIEERRLAALGTREEAAELDAERPHGVHQNNNDEVNYPTLNFPGNFSKGLKHDSVGDPDPASYGTVLRALESEDPGDFREIVLGPGGKKLTNPQSGFAFQLEGPDSQEFTMPPAPRFDSDVEAHEEGELYWMAVARDVPFSQYGTDTTIQQAVNSLNGEFPKFGGTTPVTTQNVFRGIYPGEQVGPYISQFLWKGNADPRKPAGQGGVSTDGFISYGSQTIDQRQWTVKGVPDVGSSADYLTDFTWWLNAQNGTDYRGQDKFDFTQKRFIRNLRDGANYVHFDLVINAYYNAAWYLLSQPSTNGQTPDAGAVPMRDREFPLDAGNPYDPPAPSSPTEAGFVTFGDPHVIEVLTEVIGRAGRAVWYQKWGVHRRLRPEEYGGRVDNHLAGRRTYPINASIRNSLQSGGLSSYFGSNTKRYPSYLLPQAYPEGAPTHPAYGAGHATISGACITILKAFFDESKVIEYPVLASSDGLSLLQYTGSDAGQIRVGGELNKLAGNIALFRNAAGVHWRSDYTQSLLLGEKVAIGLLQELSITFNEDDAYFQLTRFDGTTIRIQGGFVDVVPAVAGS